MLCESFIIYEYTLIIECVLTRIRIYDKSTGPMHKLYCCRSTGDCVCIDVLCVCVSSHVYVFLTNQQGRCMNCTVADRPEIVSFTVNGETGPLTLNESAADIVPISCVARGSPLPAVTLYKVNITM